MLACPHAHAQALVAAVLPASRSVTVGTPATVFATVINAGAAPATACTIAVVTPIPTSFSYFITDPATNVVMSAANPTVNIGAGAAQSYLLAFTPTAPFAPTDTQLRFDCANTDPAPVISGLNTVLLAASATPVPDVVALSLTPSGDGIVTLNSTGVFSTAAINVGASGTIVASLVASSGALPLTLTLCRTNPATAQCLAPPAPTVSTSMGANETFTFSAFVDGSAYVPFLPALNRLTLRFRDVGGATRGATSVAVRSGTLSGYWRVTVQGTAHFDNGSVGPLTPSLFEGFVTQAPASTALSGTLVVDSIDDFLPPGCSVSCPVPGSCTASCGGLVTCTVACTPATTRCAQAFQLSGTVDATLNFNLDGSQSGEIACSGQATGTISLLDTTFVTLNGSPVSLTGTHSGRADRVCSGSGALAGIECPSFSFTGTFSQGIHTLAQAIASDTAVAPLSLLWDVLTQVLRPVAARGQHSAQ